MKTAPRYESIVMATVVAPFFLFWLAAFMFSGPQESPSQHLVPAISMAVLAMLWVIAARILWRARWVVVPAQKIRRPQIAAGLLGVGASIASTADFLRMNPAAAEHLTTADVLLLAVLLAGCLLLTLLLPPRMADCGLACGLGLGAAVVLALGFVVVSRVSIHTNGGPMGWQFLGSMMVCFTVALISARACHSFSAGLQAAVLAAFVGTLLIYAVTLPEAMNRYAIDGRTLGDGEVGYGIGVNLISAIWGLLVVPLLGLPLGVIGAHLGLNTRRAIEVR